MEVFVTVIINFRTNMEEGLYNDTTVTDDDLTTTVIPTNFSINGTNDNLLYYVVSDENGSVTNYVALPFSNLTRIPDVTDGGKSFVGSQDFYMVMYTIFIIASMILTPARSLMFYKIFMNASKGLHKKMFSNVLAAPMRFFDTNPSGT